MPLTFEVGPTQFTPTSYRDYLGINPDDYVTITSFTHHPFYQPFILEIPTTPTARSTTCRCTN